MNAELTTVIGQLSLNHGNWRSKAPNQVAVREPTDPNAPGAGKGDLFIITEIQGEAPNRTELEQQLAQTVRDQYYLARGSITASLRRAVQAGSNLLYAYNRELDPDRRVVGGVVLLVMHQDDAFVAQLGPAACYAVLGDHIQRYPARSVWLDEALAPADEEDVAALGLKAVVEPNLHHLRIAPEDRLVLADSRLAGQLSLEELVRAVIDQPAKEAVKNLAKVAQAPTCSALALEVIEVPAPAIGPFKVSPPAGLSALWKRAQGAKPTPSAKTPASSQSAVSPEPPPPAPEPTEEQLAHTSATFASTSIMQKPLQWLGTFTGKQAEPPPAEALTIDDHPLPVPPPDSPAPEPEEQAVEPMRSVAAQSAPAQARPTARPPERPKPAVARTPDHVVSPQEKMIAGVEQEAEEPAAADSAQTASAAQMGQGVLKGIAAGGLMLVALLGGGLKRLLDLIRPAAGQEPRMAGTQAQQHSTPSTSTWKILRNIAIAIPLLVAAIVGITYLQQGRVREAEYQEFVTSARNKFEQAQAVEVRSALALMTEAEAALIKAEEIKPDQPEITELRQQMAVTADQMSVVQRLYHLPQLRQYTDPGTSLETIIVQGVEVYVLDVGNDRIFHHRLDDSGEALQPDDESVLMVAQGQAIDDTTIDQLLGMTWMPTGGNRQTSDLIILSQNGLLEYNPNWGLTTAALATPDSLVSPVAVDSYFGNFYVLDPQANQLLRYLPTIDGYNAAPQNYFPADQPVDLSQAVDLAIDGAIYLLFNDGRISKYLSGAPVEFEVTGLDIPFNNPVSIFTAPNEVIQHIYVADAGNRRIVQLNKDGSFVRQFKPRAGEAVNFANLQDIYVDEIGERLYILDNNNLYLGTIPTE